MGASRVGRTSIMRHEEFAVINGWLILNPWQRVRVDQVAFYSCDSGGNLEITFRNGGTFTDHVHIPGEWTYPHPALVRLDSLLLNPVKPVADPAPSGSSPPDPGW